MGDLDRRRLGRLTPASLAFARGLGLPEMYTIMVTKEACPRLPEVVRSCVGVARNLSSDPPLDTGMKTCSLQNAVEGSEPGLLDLVRLVLRTAGPRPER